LLAVQGEEHVIHGLKSDIVTDNTEANEMHDPLVCRRFGSEVEDRRGSVLDK
jgi:hypothetical protein